MRFRLATIGLLLTVSAPAGAKGIRDYSQHAPPAITLPAAGGSYVDPVFGTKIIRVTDANDGTQCMHADAYWEAFNSDETRLLISCDNVGFLYRVDAATDSFVKDGLFRGTDGPKVEYEGATWSSSDPNVVYAIGGTSLYRLDVSKRGMAGATFIHDFAGLFNYDGYYIAQMHMSSDDRVFTFHTRDGQTNAKLDVVAYDRKTGEVWTFPRGDFQIDESAVDKGGTVVSIEGASDHTGFKLWNFRAGTVDSFDWNAVDRPGGHGDLGHGTMATSDVWETGISIRNLSDPRGAGVRNIVQYLNTDGSANWNLSDHVSLRTDDERFVVGSTYGDDKTFAPFQDEVYLAYTDGSGFVRLAHTRSPQIPGQTSSWLYFAQPRASVSRSGRYIVYTSNLQSTKRVDVMVLRVPTDIVPAVTPTPTPAPTPTTPTPTTPAPSEPVPSPSVSSAPGTLGPLQAGCNLAPTSGGQGGLLLVAAFLACVRIHARTARLRRKK